MQCKVLGSMDLIVHNMTGAGRTIHTGCWRWTKNGYSSYGLLELVALSLAVCHTQSALAA